MINNSKHGLSKHKLYRVFNSMKQRCYNTNNSKYKNYGGRGIAICDEWLRDRKAFFEWAFNNGYKDGLTIDRIDVNGNYEPSNCRWVDSNKQMWNRTDTLYVIYKGEKYCMSYILRELDLLQHMGAIKKRMKNGWTFEEATQQPFDRRMMIEYNGVCKSIDEWAIFYGIKKHTLYRRLTKMKLSFEEAINYNR
nr:MAG TPA: hypothetical protein [Caudoviricetes sp.]